MNTKAIQMTLLGVLTCGVVVAGCSSKEIGSTVGGTEGSASGNAPTSAADTGQSAVDLCDTTDLAAGLTGQTHQRICDTGPSSECLTPLDGEQIGLFTSNPLVGGQAQMVDDFVPDTVPVQEAISAGGGLFEFDVAAGSYVVCVYESETR